MTGWILKTIDATTFNVVSDLAAEIASGILILALGIAYPYLVWRAMKRGHGIALDSLSGPPVSLLQALLRCREGLAAWTLLVGLALVLFVATFAHTAADAFLQFETVQVSSEQITVLGNETVASLSSYELIGDASSQTILRPGVPARKLKISEDEIAQGLSRFSVVEEQPSFEEYFTTLNNGVYELNLDTSGSFPGELGVQCAPSTLVNESVGLRHTHKYPEIFDGVKFVEGSESIVTRHVERTIPNCDYERDVSALLVDGKNSNTEWRFHSVVSFNSSEEGAATIGFINSNGRFSEAIEFGANETKLPILRDDWRFGRKIRDGLTLAFSDGASVQEIKLRESVLSSSTMEPFVYESQ